MNEYLIKKYIEEKRKRNYRKKEINGIINKIYPDDEFSCFA